jgi:DNA replication and repair protein RecF
MYIKEIILKNFRNYEILNLKFSQGINFIIGSNGSGKTNILEGISIAANIRSFKNVHDDDIIKWGENSYYCKVFSGDNDFQEFEIGCSITAGKLIKRAKIDGVEIQRASDYVGKLITVIFAPGDLLILSGAPEIRRRFFDGIISRSDKSYMEVLSEFKRILQSRNRLMKSLQSGGSVKDAEISVWDKMFAERSSVIIKKRKEFLDKFVAPFNDAYLQVAKNDIAPDIIYKGDLHDIEPGDIIENLEKRRDRDIASGTTGIGPQRDDYIFTMHNGIHFNNCASQGQKRTSAIALKIAECNFIEYLTKKRVVLLVDDIFSELDETRRKNLIQILNRENQVIFTMVNSEYENKKDFGRFKKFILDGNGGVREE